MKKLITSLMLSTALITGCDNYQSPFQHNPTKIFQQQSQQQSQQPIQQIEFYEIPNDSYKIVEIYKNHYCLPPKEENNLNFNPGRLLFRKIDHKNNLPQHSHLKIQQLEKNMNKKEFVDQTYTLGPGEYTVWILNKEVKVPVKTISSELYMQITPSWMCEPCKNQSKIIPNNTSQQQSPPLLQIPPKNLSSSQ